VVQNRVSLGPRFNVNRVSIRRGHRRHVQQFTSQRQILFACVVSEKTIVTDAVKAAGQKLQQKPSHELIRLQRHGLVARLALGTVRRSATHTSPPLEGDHQLYRLPNPRAALTSPLTYRNSWLVFPLTRRRRGIIRQRPTHSNGAIRLQFQPRFVSATASVVA